MTWEPIATHGDSEEQVLAALNDYSREGINEMRRDMRAEGWPLDAIEKAAAIVERTCREHNEKLAPQLLRNMAISAGAAALH